MAMAARTRSIELEFSMRSIWAPIQWPRQARPTAKLLAAISTPKPTSTSTDDPALLDFVEKNNDSRKTEPNSASEPAMNTNWPNSDSISPVSLSTGTTTPSDVATKMMASSSGSSSVPARFIR